MVNFTGNPRSWFGSGRTLLFERFDNLCPPRIRCFQRRQIMADRGQDIVAIAARVLGEISEMPGLEARFDPPAQRAGAGAFFLLRHCDGADRLALRQNFGRTRRGLGQVDLVPGWAVIAAHQAVAILEYLEPDDAETGHPSRSRMSSRVILTRSVFIVSIHVSMSWRTQSSVPCAPALQLVEHFRVRRRKEATAFPKLRTLPLDRARARLPVPIAIAVALRPPTGALLATGRARNGAHPKPIRRSAVKPNISRSRSALEALFTRSRIFVMRVAIGGIFGPESAQATRPWRTNAWDHPGQTLHHAWYPQVA